MITVQSQTTTRSGRIEKVVQTDDFQGLVVSLKALGWEGNIVVRVWETSELTRNYNIVRGEVVEGVMSRTEFCAMPDLDTVVISFPAPDGRKKAAAKRADPEPKAKPALQQLYEIAVVVEGSAWTMLGKRGKKEVTNTGTVNGNSGQQKYLLAVKDALGCLKTDKVSRVVVEVGDKNVRAMLKGEMQSRKNTALLSEVRALVSKFNVEIL